MVAGDFDLRGREREKFIYKMYVLFINVDCKFIILVRKKSLIRLFVVVCLSKKEFSIGFGYTQSLSLDIEFLTSNTNK